MDAEDQRHRKRDRQGSENENVHLENRSIDSTLRQGAQANSRGRSEAGNSAGLQVDGLRQAYKIAGFTREPGEMRSTGRARFRFLAGRYSATSLAFSIMTA